MKTITELRADRVAAGAAYAAAAAALASAWIELHAHDLALSNANVIDPKSMTPCEQFALGSGDAMPLQHAEFLPSPADLSYRSLTDAALLRFKQIISTL